MVFYTEWWFWLIIGIIALVIIIFIWIWNRLIVLENRIDNAWAQIGVQLKKRNDLIPNLVRTVKGYAKHEKTVFTDITKARAAITKAKGVKDKLKAENFLTGALKTLFAVAENYPNLIASKNFMQLQEELSGIESKIAYSRQFYNDSVLRFNNLVEKFPSNMVAGMRGNKEKPYFKVQVTETKVPRIEF